MSAPTSPVIKGWELGVRLREYREQSGLTATEAGKRIGVTQAHVSAIEAGRPKLTADRLKQLVTIYDIGTTEATELEDLRAGSAERGWWHQYSGLFSAELQRYFGLEAGAEQIRGYYCELMPGLLQTNEYARAVITGGYPYTRMTEVDRRVQARMRRNERLTGPQPLQVTSLLSQSTLLYHIGGTEVMRSQLHHLMRLMKERDNIDIRIVPFSAGAHPGIGGQFVVLSFASPLLHDLIWQEILTSTGIVDSPGKVTEYVVTLHEIEKISLGHDDSYDLIRESAKDLT